MDDEYFAFAQAAITTGAARSEVYDRTVGSMRNRSAAAAGCAKGSRAARCHIHGLVGYGLHVVERLLCSGMVGSKACIV
jgi:hypothetical protein